MKQVRLTVDTAAGKVEVGKADLQKNSEGQVEVNMTITNLKVHDQLGGNKITGIVTNYEGDDLDE